MFVSWRNNLKEEKAQSPSPGTSSHPANKEDASPGYDLQGTIFYVNAETALWGQTTLKRMSLACLGHCKRGHCLYKWTSASGTRGIIKTQELSELHMLVPKLPHRPSAPESRGTGCQASFRLPGSVKDLWKRWKSGKSHLAFVCFILVLNLLCPQGCKMALLSPI